MREAIIQSSRFNVKEGLEMWENASKVLYSDVLLIAHHPNSFIS